MADAPTLIKAAQAAEMLGVTAPRIYQLMDSGDLPRWVHSWHVFTSAEAVQALGSDREARSKAAKMSSVERAKAAILARERGHSYAEITTEPAS